MERQTIIVLIISTDVRENCPNLRVTEFHPSQSKRGAGLWKTSLLSGGEKTPAQAKLTFANSIIDGNYQAGDIKRIRHTERKKLDERYQTLA